MKSTILSLLLSVTFSFSSGQGQNPNWLDFWIGDWTLTWIKDGKVYTGKNSITRTLAGKIIKEEFNDPSANYQGLSVSAYNARQDKWFQTWVDSEGLYLTFIGESEGQNKIFKTTMIDRSGQKFQQRMVFSNIQKDSFNWKWEATNDEGVTWTINWEIEYKRTKP